MKKNYRLYVGTYASKDQTGIYAYDIDARTQEIELKIECNGISNPSYLAISEDNKYLYSVMEDMKYDGDFGGGFAVLECNPNSLQKLYSVCTKGTLPCHVMLEPERKYAFVSNYMSGSLSMFTLNKDDPMLDLCDFKQHTGKGANPIRQESSHIHFTGLDTHNSGLWCVDLGQDKLIYYMIDYKSNKIEHHKERDIQLPAGCGCRHFVISPTNKDIMYIVCELSSEVFVVNISNTKPEIIQRISTLKTENEQSTCAAIKCSEDGRFLYASNRGDDSIVVYEIDEKDGTVKLIQIQSTGGKSPRDFLILEDMIFVANQDSDIITIFFRDLTTGKLSQSSKYLNCNSPVCLIAQSL